MDAFPIGSHTEGQPSSHLNPLVTAYLVVAGGVLPLVCIAVESLEHSCRAGCGIDPIQYPWQVVSVLAVSVTHWLQLGGARGPRLWPMLAWSLFLCCGYTVWFAPPAPLGLYAGLPGLLMFGPLAALVSTLLLIGRAGLPRQVFWLACLTGYSCLAYALKLSASTIFCGGPF